MRTMFFVDHMNFYLSAVNYYKAMGKFLPSFDYQVLLKEINAKLPFDSELMKAQIFFPRTEAPLDTIEPYRSSNRWIDVLKAKPYLDVIEGRNQVRPIGTFNIEDPSSYTIDEKGTDINIAVQVLTKAYHNSFDNAVILSGDSDYVPVLQVLRTMGKITNIACMVNQQLNKSLTEACDHILHIDEALITKAITGKDKSRNL